MDEIGRPPEEVRVVKSHETVFNNAFLCRS